ncbi:MAG: STAS domain-containing protein [Alphaproteobacteria bacterium]|nr:STAS domain-containing protein [Alphaproteobacteria bacterium]
MQQSVEIAPWAVTEPEIMDADRYLTGANAPEFEEDISLCIQSGARSMILDCSRLTYMTCAGMRVFFSIAHKMNACGGTVFIKGLKGQPRHIYFSCGMDVIVPLVKEERRSPAIRSCSSAPNR